MKASPELAKMGVMGAYTTHVRPKELFKLDLSTLRDGLHIRKRSIFSKIR